MLFYDGESGALWLKIKVGVKIYDWPRDTIAYFVDVRSAMITFHIGHPTETSAILTSL